ncbi:MAG: hypothetical protein H6558_15935 [Lewinellaceae bacterium]|nr:hypothetical protein [Lewinellaceae bacterium]
MSREISLFTDYHQRENSVTNYCGLVMKLIYEESPKRFEELLATLIQSDVDIPVGPIFTQQTKKQSSVPDLAITQSPFSIFFENKLADWFYSDQIERHIEGFNNSTETKILFLLSNFEEDNLHERFQEEIGKAKKSGIILQPISYEDFIGALENIATSEYLNNILEEFKIYLDRNDLLPKWKYLLDVVNCSGTLHEVENFSYMCPDKGGAYSHRRAKYFGPYSQKKVSRIYEIDAVVSIGRELGEGVVKWKNRKIKDEELIRLAKTKIQKWDYRIRENEGIPIQVFLLRGGEETNFFKESSGGMQQSKLYFWEIAKGIHSSSELATTLRGRRWEDFK